jgi:beta-phosphoglucomutase
MDWIHRFHLFLLDFDGLLVNTEEIHYLAYKRMCLAHGIDLPWSFEYYCSLAHYTADGLKLQIYAQYPELKIMEPLWNVLYLEKKKAVIDLINEGAVHLMPGVEQLLKALQTSSIKRCVVTHSPDELIHAVRIQNPILNTIPVWYTRESYSNPKPHPECYLKAIHELADPADKIIGFEDTPRGIEALLKTPAKPVLISQTSYPEIPFFLKKGVEHFSVLESIPSDWMK